VTRTARIVKKFSAIKQRDWDQLDHSDNPFLSYAFLEALEFSGSVSAETGWQPHHLCLFEQDQLVACAPSYLKSHSHGEFVFDWSWADAYQRYGKAYYPKLLTAIPYSPVPGPRLLTRCDHAQTTRLKEELVALAVSQTEELDLSSWHCNFVESGDCDKLQSELLMARTDWQFHWFNRGYENFDDFLAQLRSKKRKNIRRDRRLVTDAGVRFIHKLGGDLDLDELDFVFSCYQQTFFEHGNHPALNHAFFARLADKLPESVLAVIAMRGEQRIAMSMYLTGNKRLYGRYWGCIESVPGLHFETAYHQGIEFCIEKNLDVFEPGAQGEHKISRGFTPVRTHSFHLVRDPVFRTAISDYLQRERSWMEEYRQELGQREPFRVDLKRTGLKSEQP
jgi:predicted N-acyltransferase